MGECFPELGNMAYKSPSRGFFRPREGDFDVSRRCLMIRLKNRRSRILFTATLSLRFNQQQRESEEG